MRTPTKHVVLFMDRFVDPIRQRTKRITIRPLGRRVILPGHTLSLRTWSGVARRSSHVPIFAKPVVCTWVALVAWDFDRPRLGLRVDGRPIASDEDLHAFVVADGFRDVDAFASFHSTHHYGTTRTDGRRLIGWGSIPTCEEAP